MRAVHIIRSVLLGSALIAAAPASRHAMAAQASGRIRGHIRLSGKLPGNSVIRMGKDPMCAQINRGTQVVQEAVIAAADGSLGNVFVVVQGKFPSTTPPSSSVTIDQRGCIYRPRVIGARVGQALQIRNDDPMLHNTHSLSTLGNSFNVAQPASGMVYTFGLRDEELMLALKCDIHSWMTAYIGVVSHPYFAVTAAAGTFDIANVPAGSHTVRAWHERYGWLTQTVRVTAGAAANVEFTYTGREKPPAAGIQELTLPPDALNAQLTIADRWR